MRKSFFIVLLFISACKMQSKEFVSNYSWFTLNYPEHWTQFEEENSTYLFLDTLNWKGNLRITALRQNSENEEERKEYLRSGLNDELTKNPGVIKMKLGKMDAVYYTKNLEQDGNNYLMYYWATGDKTTLIICTFIIDKKREKEEEIKEELNYVIKTLSTIKVLE